MSRPFKFAIAVLLILACTGCEAVGDALIDGAGDWAVSGITGESSEQRKDRWEVERLREDAARKTPSFASYDREKIDKEARDEFQKKHGHEPRLKWDGDYPERPQDPFAAGSN